MSFWDSKLNNGGQVPAAAPPRTPYYQAPPAAAAQPSQYGSQWWSAAPAQQAPLPDVSGYVPGRDGPPLEELARMPADQLSQQAMEMIAAWHLQTDQRYANVCPHCGSKNGLVKPSPSVAAQCFECGYSERQVHDQLQPLSTLSGGKNSTHARDFVGGNVAGGNFQHVTSAQWQPSANGMAPSTPGA